MRKINYIVVHCSATREGCTLTSEVLEAEHRRRGFRTTGYHYYIRRDGTVLGTARCALPRSQQVFDRYLLRMRAGCPGKSEGYPYAGAAFGPAPAGVPAATTVPERPCMRPPRPQSRFGRRWDGGAVGVGEAVSVLRGK